MLHDVVRASYKGGYKIEVTFEDEKTGVIDFSGYLDKGGVFERFRDIAFFRSFSIDEELGVLTWQGEIDIAPETLYAEATGAPLPRWMAQSRRDIREGVESGGPLPWNPQETKEGGRKRRAARSAGKS